MDVFTLANDSGMAVRFLAHGGIIVSIRVPDRNGEFADVTPGYDLPEEYLSDPRYFGALIGRYANRIAGGRFTLDGVEYELAHNEGENLLHGGPNGFHTREWDVTPSRDRKRAVLCYTSPAGEEGFPGRLATTVTYSLGDDNAFTIDFAATTDAPTPVNFTQHAYFNLAGHDGGSVLGHELFLNASSFTAVDGSLIPTGEVRPVRNTAFDFTEQRPIGDGILRGDEQLEIAGGFDHNFVLDARVPGRVVLAARVYEPLSGRTLDVLTTEPGVQFYSGNGLDGGPQGKGGWRYAKYGAFALETQHFPDSPNHSQFPSTILRPGEEFRSRTIWRFSAQ